MARNGDLSKAQENHLKLSGISVKRRPWKDRPFKQFSVWWEQTALEKQLEDLAGMLDKFAFIDLVNIFAGLAIIVSLGSWLLNGEERREEVLISSMELIYEHPRDPTGIVKIALERLVEADLTPDRLDLTLVNLAGARLAGARLSLAELDNADLAKANLRRANLFSANLENVQLFAADLSGADLRGADLSGADLRGADLNGADLRGARLINVFYNEATIWPEDFDPPPSVDLIPSRADDESLSRDDDPASIVYDQNPPESGND